MGDVTRHTGVSRSTLFRWLAGDWQQYPELAKVCGLCAALDLPIGAAMRPLVLPGATRRGRRPQRGGGRGRHQRHSAADGRQICPEAEKHQIQNPSRRLWVAYGRGRGRAAARRTG
ncbi:XRE family transcriptional regulator [Micromonospora sp. NPDC005206]|uniref:XRE family transcriptional regulator n=1 Tax=Micromonospora sp. NPDC005206 TaxID=3157022 RepID=UPI0033A5906B